MALRFLSNQTIDSTLDLTGRVKVSGSSTDQYFYEGARTGVGVTFSLYDNANNVYFNGYSGIVLRANQIGGSGGSIVLSGGNVGVGIVPASSVALDVKEPDASNDLILGLTAGTGSRAQIRSVVQTSTESALSFHTTLSSSTQERFRILNTGAFSLGNSGTNYGSAGQVLTSNGNSAPYWSTPTSGTITGSGTANYVTKFTGTTAIGNSSIVDNGSIVTMNQDIHMDNGSASTMLVFRNDAKTRKIQLWSTANNDYEFYGFGVEGSTLVYSVYSTSDDHVFFSGASSTSRNELMRIKGNGSVGINDTNPLATLSVISKDSTYPTQTVVNAAGGGDGYVFQRWQYVSGTTAYRCDLKQKVTSGVVRYAFDVTNNTTDYPNNLVLDRGNVGIGTSSPSSLLHISGSGTVARLQSSSSYVDMILVSSGNTGFLNLGATGMNFYVNGGSASNLHMHISNAGNVGIGTDTPDKKLEIFGSGSENGILVKNDTNTNYRGIYFGATESDNTSYGKVHMSTQTGELNITAGFTGWGGIITLDTNGSERMRIDSANNTNVSIKAVSGAAGNEASLSLWGTNLGGFGGSLIAQSRIDSLTDGTAYGSIMRFYTNNTSNTLTERMRITSGGQIVFQKTDNTTLPAGSINHASNDFLYVTGGTGGASFGDDNHNTRMIVFNDDYVRFDTAGTDRMRIDSSGNLLVTKQVANNATVGNQFMTDGSANSTVNGDTVARFNRLTSDGEIIRLQKDTSTVGSIGSTTSYLSGSLGIGVSSPNAKLEVNGDISIRGGNGLYFGQSTGNLNSWTTRLFSSGSTQYFNAQTFIFNNSGYGSTEFVRFTSGGRVGVGVTNPSARLQVNYDGNNGGGDLTGYGILHQSSASGQATIGAHNTGDGYANLNLSSVVGGVPKLWHISKRPNSNSNRLEYFFYDNTFYSRFIFTYLGDFHADGDIVAYSTTASDEKLKDNIEPIHNALDKVSKLNGVSFTWNCGSRKNEKDLGVLAQNVEKVLPELVREKESPYHDDQTIKTVDYEKLTAVLIEAVKDLQQKVEKLENKKCCCK